MLTGWQQQIDANRACVPERRVQTLPIRGLAQAPQAPAKPVQA